MNSSLRRIALGAAILTMPAGVFAQSWTPASEVVGQPIQVTTNGITNTVTLIPGGEATIASPAGRVVDARWSAGEGRMCLNTAGAQECWPYTAPFQAGQPVTVTSSCNAVSTWLVAATNTPAPSQSGERGR